MFPPLVTDVDKPQAETQKLRFTEYSKPEVCSPTSHSLCFVSLYHCPHIHCITDATRLHITMVGGAGIRMYEWEDGWTLTFIFYLSCLQAIAEEEAAGLKDQATTEKLTAIVNDINATLKGL